MTFEDLPDDWPHRPVTDSALFDDVIDLLVPERDRCSGALHLLLCDNGGRLIQPCAVGDLPPACQPDPRVIAPFAQALREHCAGGGLVVVLARPGRALPQDTDVLWMRAAETVCADAEVRLLAAAVATPDGVFRLTTPDPQPCG